MTDCSSPTPLPILFVYAHLRLFYIYGRDTPHPHVSVPFYTFQTFPSRPAITSRITPDASPELTADQPTLYIFMSAFQVPDSGARANFQRSGTARDSPPDPGSAAGSVPGGRTQITAARRSPCPPTGHRTCEPVTVPTGSVRSIIKGSLVAELCCFLRNKALLGGSWGAGERFRRVIRPLLARRPPPAARLHLRRRRQE